MKKTPLLHPELSRVIARMGHTDKLVVADAGLPIPLEVQRIDLALTPGIPSFLDTLRVIAGELAVEEFMIAEELQEGNPALVADIQALFPDAKMFVVRHAQLKVITGSARAVVRTGETTPYANVILFSGVTF
jgi:D-ribose pyranase